MMITLYYYYYYYYYYHYYYLTIPVTSRSKAWVCGCSLAGIVSSNSAGGTDVCLL
jgi:hypothetical protein